jgi:hypothetical protein
MPPSALNVQASVIAEAKRGCAIYNCVPVPLSRRYINTGGWSGKYEFLFACMDPSHTNMTPRMS